MKKIDYKEIEDKVYNFKTVSEYGFIQSELEEILKNYPDIHMDKFNDAMMGNTCMMHGNQIVNYFIDVYHAIIAGLEDRNLTLAEWD